MPLHFRPDGSALLTIPGWTKAVEESKKSQGACTCPPEAVYPWDCIDCPACGEKATVEADAQAQAEIDAEYAWLREAEGWNRPPLTEEEIWSGRHD